MLPIFDRVGYQVLTSAQTSTPGGAQSPAEGEVYTQDGDYIKDLEINDLRNRYTLTKGSTQKMVNISVITH